MEVRAAVNHIEGHGLGLANESGEQAHRTESIRAPSGVYCRQCQKRVPTGTPVLQCTLCNVAFWHRRCFGRPDPCRAAPTARRDHFDACPPLEPPRDPAHIDLRDEIVCRGQAAGTAEFRPLHLLLGRGLLWGAGETVLFGLGLACMQIKERDEPDDAAGRTFHAILAEQDHKPCLELAFDTARQRSDWTSAIEHAATCQYAKLGLDKWSSLPERDGWLLNVTESVALRRAVLGHDEPSLRAARVLDAEEATVPLSVKIQGATDLPEVPEATFVHVVVRVLAQGSLLDHAVATCGAAAGKKIEWTGMWLKVASELGRLHANVVLLFTVKWTGPNLDGLPDDEKTAHAHMSLCDAAGRVRQGDHMLSLWPGAGSRFAWNMDSSVNANDHRGTLSVWVGPPADTCGDREVRPLTYSSHPVHWIDAPLPLLHWSESGPNFITGLNGSSPIERSSGLRSSEHRSNVLSADLQSSHNPLEMPKQEDCLLHWHSRDPVDAESVTLALAATRGVTAKERKEIGELCNQVDEIGTRIPRFLSTQLLSHLHSLDHVRTFAMRHSLAWDDSAFKADSPLGLLAMPIFGFLAFGSHHYSGAAVLLLRFLRSRPKGPLAHAYFWAVQSLSEQSTGLRSRFTLYMQVFLEMLPENIAKTMRSDADYIGAVNQCARDEARRNVPFAELVQKHHPALLGTEPHSLPLGFGTKIAGLDLDKSKALPSNAAPLLLQFKPASAQDPVPPAYIFKAGDDLASDQLIILFAKFFNRIWEGAKVDAEIVMYGVAPTGDRVGMIELVPGCSSLGKVQGSWKGALFKKSVITDWFKSEDAPSDYKERYVRTLAGAIVLEWALGLGDRHCDNLLLKGGAAGKQECGKIFHIDFGCCFGRDYGFATDAPVTLTSQMMHVIPPAEHDAFINLVADAFMAVREQHVILTTLALSALGARLPYVSKVSDVQVLVDRLDVHSLHPGARKNFIDNVLQRALSMKKQQINDGLHLWYMKNIYKPPAGSQ